MPIMADISKSILPTYATCRFFTHFVELHIRRFDYTSLFGHTCEHTYVYDKCGVTTVGRYNVWRLTLGDEVVEQHH